MLVAVSLASVVLSGVAFALHFLHRADRELKAAMAYDVVLPRLSAQWRTDAHAASSVEGLAADGLAPPIFVLPDGSRIDYGEAGPHIERRVLLGTQVIHRELYLLDSTDQVTWGQTESRPPLVQMRIHKTRKRLGDSFSQIDLIEAALGLDHLGMEDR